MLEKVVVGVDGADTPRRVVEWCRKALPGTGARVVAVACHTYRPELGEHSNDQLRAELTADVGTFCSELETDGITCDVVIVDGDPRVALHEIASERGADMLVLGSRGHSQISDLMLGSVASYLTHHCPVPVLVVR